MTYERIHGALESLELSQHYFQEFKDNQVDDSEVEIYIDAPKMIHNPLKKLIRNAEHRANFIHAFKTIQNSAQITTTNTVSSDVLSDWNEFNIEDFPSSTTTTATVETGINHEFLRTFRRNGSEAELINFSVCLPNPASAMTLANLTIVQSEEEFFNHEPLTEYYPRSKQKSYFEKLRQKCQNPLLLRSWTKTISNVKDSNFGFSKFRSNAVRINQDENGMGWREQILEPSVKQDLGKKTVAIKEMETQL